MKWYEVTLISTHEGADLFADALFSVGCSGVSIYDKADVVSLYDSDVVWDYIDENLVNNLDERVYVKGIIGEEEKNAVLQKLQENANEKLKIKINMCLQLLLQFTKYLSIFVITMKSNL